jgi:hypothetical protein
LALHGALGLPAIGDVERRVDDGTIRIRDRDPFEGSTKAGSTIWIDANIAVVRDADQPPCTLPDPSSRWPNASEPRMR